MDFAEFRPIQRNIKQEMLSYYNDNNLKIPDNSYLLDYLSSEESPKIESKFYKGQSSSKPTSKQVPKKIPVKKIDHTKVDLDKKIPTPLLASKSILEQTSDSTEFIKEFTPLVEHYSKQLGLPTDLMLAQIALESGWGKKAPGFNYGGQKVGKDWKGKEQSFTTTEFIKNKGLIKTNSEKFRAYNSPNEGIKGYFDFFKSYKRYQPLFGISDPYKGADIMHKTKYATDPKYNKKLKEVIKTVQRLRKENNI